MYLSRTQIKTGFCHSFGEGLIEKILSDNGYEVLYPERMSLGQQIEKYSNASVIITTNGTLGHNVLYAPSDVRLCILDRVHDSKVLNMHQQAISKIMKNEVIAVRCSSKYSGHAVSFMWISDELLEAFVRLDIKMKKNFTYKLLFGVEYLFFRVWNAIWRIKNYMASKIKMRNSNGD